MDEVASLRHRVLELENELAERLRAFEALRETEQRLREVTDTVELQASEAKWRKITESSPDYLLTLDADLRIQFANRAAPGLTTEGLIGKPLLSFASEDRQSRVTRLLEEVLRTGEPVTYEAVYDPEDGPRMFFESRVVRTQSDDGTFGLILNARDITERKRAKDTIGESEAKYRDLVETSQDLIWKCDGDGRFTYLNPAWEESHGYTLDEMLGRPFTDFMSPEVAQHDLDEFGRLLAGGRVAGYETVHLSKSGDPIHLVFTAIPLRDTHGDIVGTQGTAYNFTAWKLEEERRISLEQQVRHSQKLESLGVLAGGIAHDFNNLLMGVLGNADLALSDLSPTSPARDSVEEIIMAARSAAELARQMLAYSGKGHFVVEPLNLTRILVEMDALIRSSVSKTTDLSYDLREDLPNISADATQVRQIVLNLLTNASESLGEDGCCVTVSTGILDCDRAFLDGVSFSEGCEEGSYAYLEVTDQGAGMDAEALAKMFDPFYTTKFTGRGLGLAVVLGIVRGHGAAINVVTAPGTGTSMTVLFPVVDRLSDSPEEPEAPGEDVLDGTVLLVDDDSMVLDVGRRMLEKANVRVAVASDGAEAVEIFARSSDEIDCVLLDLTMPRMGGLETLEALRRIRKDIPVILSSGYFKEELESRFGDQGFDDFIQKPYQWAELRCLVSRALKSAS